MRYFKFVEPTSAEDMSPKETIMSEKAILEQYFAYWSKQMILANKEHLISKEKCIEDFCTIHWAWEIHDCS